MTSFPAHLPKSQVLSQERGGRGKSDLGGWVGAIERGSTLEVVHKLARNHLVVPSKKPCQDPLA